MEYVGAWAGSMEPLVDASEPILDSSAPSGDTAKRGPEALVAVGKRSYSAVARRLREHDRNRLSIECVRAYQLHL